MALTAETTFDAAKPARRPWAPYLEMTRPRVLLLVLFTAPPVLLIGQEAAVGWARGAAILAATLLVGAACSVFNAWYERESDALMDRTKARPLPSGRVSAGSALAFGWLLSALGVGGLWVSGGWLAALIGALALIHYAVLYTMILKPRTAQNIVIGGASGAVAPLIADAAADGRLGALGWALFALVVLWTPPHFWAIALVRAKDYAAAHIPMMPAVVGRQGTRWRMLAYAVACLPVSLVPVWSGDASIGYGIVATLMGVWFVLVHFQAIDEDCDRGDWRVFGVSITYLTVVFGVLLAEGIVGAI